jgi:hypothetical protein
MKQILEQHKLWLQGKGGKKADLCGADLHGADLRGADLRRADLRGSVLDSANLELAYLQQADLCFAALRKANLHGAKLMGVRLMGAYLQDADLCFASLQYAYVLRAYMQSADLRDADLRDADLRDADLWGAKFEGANLVGTCLDPNNEPSGAYKSCFNFEDGRAVGYRTKSNYEVYKTYTAPVFSTAPTDCHPGLYLWPTLQHAIVYSGDWNVFIKVSARPEDVHQAGVKYRCKEFRVEEVCV